MQTLQNAILLDFENNPPLKEWASTLKVGEKCSIVVDLQINEITDKNLTGTIEALEPSNYSNPNPAEGESEDEVKPTVEAPVLMALGQKLSQSPD